jgi:hypothetical protein
MPRGGYQKPGKPAAVSGPGRKSQRTDGGPGQKMRDLPDAQYGEAQTFRDLQQQAPLANDTTGGGGPVPSGAPVPSPVPFDAPTQNPDEPVTAGNPMGPGAGPIGGAPSKDDLARFKPLLPILQVQANKPGASQELRTFLQYLKGSL